MVKEESLKAGLKFNIQRTKMMAYGSITSRQIEVGKVERVADFIFLCSKITADGDFRHEIGILAPRNKSSEIPRQYIKKQRHHSSNKLCIVQGVVFPVVMYRCESCTIKKVQCWRIDSSCCAGEDSWESLGLQGDQTILKESNSEYSLEGLMLKLKLQYFGDLWKAGSSEKTLLLEKVQDRKQREQQSMRWFDGVISSSDMNWRKLWEIVEDRGACSARCQDGHCLASEQQNSKGQPHEEGDPLRSRRSVRVPVGDYNTSENNLRKVWCVPGVQT